MFTLNYVSLFSSSFHYLRMIRQWNELAALLPEKEQRWIIPTLPLLLIYLQQYIAGLPSVNAVEGVLLTNERTMRIADFNAHQIAEGICRRGRHRRRAATPPGRTRVR